MASGWTLARARSSRFWAATAPARPRRCRSLVGLTRAREGAVRIFGQATTDWPPYRVAALGVGYVPEGRRIFPNLTVEENLKVPLERPGDWTIARVFDLFPSLAQRKSNKGRQLSGGEQEMLAIARALLLNPRLLILDEPSQGLAPIVVQEVFRVVTTARAAGISVLSGRTECARGGGDRRPRLCPRRRAYRLFRRRGRFRQGRGPRPGVGRGQCGRMEINAVVVYNIFVYIRERGRA